MGKGLAVNVKPELFLQSGMPQSANSASPELIKLRGARVILASEPPAELALNMAAVKRLTGGDPISARSLYGQSQTFFPRGLIFFASNLMPPIDSTDLASANRIAPIPFRSLFSDQAPDDVEEQIANRHFKVTSVFLSR
jgi:putative DNA primase/helicase